MLFSKDFNKFFWITSDNRLACAESTSGDENGVIDAATIYYLDQDIKDVFTISLGGIVDTLLAQRSA